ncbi:GAF domain-containing protein [Pelagicoccus mobilis]|uniref:GAF domain-containing protein n=1 Tax=Pelagicoccus mobilis TaxID=415221 RepID=A0A934S0L9_9BACT|nr:GAF domain-containing protein [Pelagicoccus mobilis]MBK1880136.1 GAF domain-containing protein [Pelagicoccus mobilis]
MLKTKQLLADRTKATKEEIFKSVCIDAAEQLDADLTSVWTFNEKKTQIECQLRYDALDETYTSGLVLKKEDYPRYFKAIVEENIVNAPMARTQIATKEFTESYFEPNGIHSLLDFILHDDHVPVGVLCCENRRGVRQWSREDEDFLRSLATLTSFLFFPNLD